MMSTFKARTGKLPPAVDEALLNHLVLPLQLPQAQDRDLDSIEGALFGRLTEAAKLMRDLPKNDASSLWDSISRSLVSSRSFSVGGRLERSSLLRELRHVAKADFIFLYIRSQNAGVYIRRSAE